MEFCVKLLSLPLWERGLKYTSAAQWPNFTTSLPLWERGLKLWEFIISSLLVFVAPLVGAWIEMCFKIIFNCNQSLSLPLWERGLNY